MQLFNSLIYMIGEMAPYILLGFLIAGLMHAFVPQRTMAHHLSGSGWKSVLKATLLGIPLPLCSCGVLPTAIGMRRQGASNASTTAFLIATPQTGVDSIAATYSLLGPAFAVVRPVAALVTAVGGGLAAGRSDNSGHSDCKDDHCHAPQPAVAESETAGKSFFGKLLLALRYGFIDLLGSIGGWLTIGLIVAAVITVYVPADVFAVFADRPWLSMLAVLIVAVPMYVCATGSIPIALSLVMKGLSPGTAFVLLMAGPAVNFASMTLISREMGRRAAAVYISAIVIGALLFGLAIDYLLPTGWFMGGHADAHACCAAPSLPLFPTICSVVLVALLIYTFIKNHIHKTITPTEMTREYNVKGMNCPHCQAAVTRAIAAVEGVESVDVNLSTGVATVQGTPSPEAIAAAVRAAGFDLA